MNYGLKDKIIKLVESGKTYNEICAILHCAKGTVSYHSKKAKLVSKNKPRILTEDEVKNIQSYYLTHTQLQTAEHFGISRTTVIRYCPNKTVPLTAEELRKRNYARLKNRRMDLKKRAIEYKGGKCEKCGYNTCLQALDFHHINPEHKDFTIAQTRLYFTWEKIRAELDKCILVCANCHREIHNPPLV